MQTKPFSSQWFLMNIEIIRTYLIFPSSHCYIYTWIYWSFLNSSNIPGTSGAPILSRCSYDKPTDAKPLSGMRIAIKDNIDLKGVRTSAFNRAYQALYPVKARNTACVEKLLEAGAVIVGKTKTVQFASGENARDWIGFFPPFSPRGDGYQDSGYSSAASATAASAYDWIDATLGTDSSYIFRSRCSFH
jgi:hypothetical protein